MSNENITLEEKQSQEEPQQQALTEAIEEVKGTIKPSTRAIRLATNSRLLDRHTTQLNKVGQKFQPIQTQMDRISKMVQPIQKQLKTIEKQTVRQMQTQIKQLQKQVSQIQKENQKIRSLLLSNKKKVSPAKNQNIKRRGARKAKGKG